MVQQLQLLVGQLAAHGHQIFFRQVGLRPDHGLGHHAVLAHQQQAPAFHVQAAHRRQLAVAVGHGGLVAPQGLAGQQAHGGDLARLRLGGDDAARLVDQDRHGVGQRRLGLVRQGQSLAGLDLTPDVLHDLVVDADQTLTDQRLGLAARADAALRQPFVDALRFGFVVTTGPGHGPD